MLKDFIYHRDHILKTAEKEKERYYQTGESRDEKTKAQAAALGGVRAENIIVTLIDLIANLQWAKLRLQSKDSDDDVNSALIEIDEIGRSLRLLVDGLKCTDGKLNDEEAEE